MDILQQALAEAGFEEDGMDDEDVDDVLAPAHAPDQAQAQTEVTTTYRGRPAVMKGGYTYIIKSTVKTTTYWRCILCNKENCKATAKSGEGSTELTITNGHHSHDPDRIRMKVRQIISAVKQQARDRKQTSSAVIVDEAMYGLDPAVALAINRQNLVRMANREKRSDGSYQLNQPLAHIEWPEAFTVTAGNPAEPFLLYDSRLHEEGQSVIFIFASPNQLTQLRDNDHWSADGTFWCAPRQFEQLYTVHAIIGHSSVPGAYILTEDRLQTTYERALRALVHYGGLQGVEPRTVMHDFELPAINAFKNVFRHSAIRLCLFHLAQAVWRNIGDHGLTRLYKQNKKVRELLRSFVALALVPTADVVRSLDLLVAEINRLLTVPNEIPADFDQGLRGFLEYFEKTYVHRLDPRGRLGDARFKPALWNCYQAVLQGMHRTNNAVEGWHYEFNQTFHRPHMALDKFVQRLQMDESKNRQRLDRHEFYQAEPLRNRRKACYEEADKHILAVARKYATHYLPNGQVLRYLRCMQFHLAQAVFDVREQRGDRNDAAVGDDDGQDGGNDNGAEAEAVEDDAADNADDYIPLNESHPGQESDDDAMEYDSPPPASQPMARLQDLVQAAVAAPRVDDNDMLPGFSQASARPSASQPSQRRVPSTIRARFALPTGPSHLPL